MRKLFYVFRSVFMLFCNFLRINPQLLVQKLRGHNYTISEFAMPFCRWEKHSKFWERIINEVFILPVRFMPSINGLLILPVKFTQNWQNKQRHFYSTSNIARRLSKSIVAWKIHMGRSFWIVCTAGKSQCSASDAVIQRPRPQKYCNVFKRYM